VQHSEFEFTIPAITKLRLNRLRKTSAQNPWSVLLGGSPRIYAGQERFSAGDREIPPKAHFKIDPFPLD
jgi:hypothetical protein